MNEPLSPAELRYRNEVAFRTLVDSLASLILEGKASVRDVYQAIDLAAKQYEERERWGLLFRLAEERRKGKEKEEEARTKGEGSR